MLLRSATHMGGGGVLLRSGTHGGVLLRSDTHGGVLLRSDTHMGGGTFEVWYTYGGGGYF